MPTRDEKYQGAFDAAVAEFKADRPDIIRMTTICLVPGMKPIWMGYGIIKCMWGYDAITVFGVGKTTRVAMPDEALHAVDLMQNALLCFKEEESEPIGGNETGA